MEDKLIKVKEAIKDLLQSEPDISGVSVYIGEDRKDVTIAVDILAKLVEVSDKEE